MTQSSEQCAKKLYQQPVLKVYGTIEAVTLSAGKLSMSPDGGPNSSKTF